MNLITYPVPLDSYTANDALQQVLKYDKTIVLEGSGDESEEFLKPFRKLIKEKKLRLKEIDCTLKKNLGEIVDNIIRYNNKRIKNPNLRRFLKTYYVLKDTTNEFIDPKSKDLKEEFKDLKEYFYIIDLGGCLGYS